MTHVSAENESQRRRTRNEESEWIRRREIEIGWFQNLFWLNVDIQNLLKILAQSENDPMTCLRPQCWPSGRVDNTASPRFRSESLGLLFDWGCCNAVRSKLVLYHLWPENDRKWLFGEILFYGTNFEINFWRKVLSLKKNLHKQVNNQYAIQIFILTRDLLTNTSA